MKQGIFKDRENDWKIAKPISLKIIKEHSSFPSFILQLLYNRKVFSLSDSSKKREEKIKKFLYPSYDDLFNPFLMKDMDKAIRRINQALNKDEKIAIFGDYDADGVTASALLYETFIFLGKKAEVYIPHREHEGYGLNKEAIDKLSKKGITLIITVDCGIKNNQEINYAKKLGIDVIVTDHHEISGNLPKKAVAILNPKQKECKYPFKELAGVGIAFKLASALIKKIRNNKKGENFLKWLLDLVLIGSLGDSVSLISENRILVKYGEIVFKKTRRIGLKELKNRGMKNGDLKIIDFFIVPRLNACGRMDHANWAFNLLVTKSKIEAFKLINKIEELNNKRKNFTEKIFSEIESLNTPLSKKIIILLRENWPSSVLGIVANRLSEKYKIPVFLIENKGEISRGSARVPEEFDVMEMLEEISHMFLKFGGHKYAAGFTYKTDNHHKIVKKLEDVVKNKIKKETKKETKNLLYIDVEVDFEDITKPYFYKEIKKLGPFGKDNPHPVFLVRNTKILEKRIVGNNHLKIWFSKNNKKIEAIAFSKKEWNFKIEEGEFIDFIFKLRENFYLGTFFVQTEIIDFRNS